MKRLTLLFSLLLCFGLMTAEVAHAKRLGGGSSMGRSFQIAPSKAAPNKAAPQHANKSSNDTAAATNKAPAASKAGGMMGGLFAGLLAGGLLAALFAGGAFDGLQIMDVVIVALVAWLLFRLLRRPSAMQRQPAPAYAGGGSASPTPAPSARASLATASSHGAIPMNLPLGFDSPSFLSEAQVHFRTLQQAWNDNNLQTLEEYFSPELFEALKAQRAALAVSPATEILALDAEIVRAEQRFGMAEVSIRFVGHYRDVVAQEDEAFTDVWHLERDYSNDNAPWHIIGITSA